VWLMAAHVRQRVKKIRAARLHDFQYVPVPGDENTAVYLAALREQRAAVATGAASRHLPYRPDRTAAPSCGGW
jgi:hypothetical protein